MQTKSQASLIFANYFNERETNFEHRSEIFKKMFNHSRELEMTQVKFAAEVEALKLRDKANGEIMSELTNMFLGSEDV